MKKKLIATLMSFVLTFGVVSNVAVFAAEGAGFADLNVWVSSEGGYSKDVIGSIPSDLPDNVVAQEIATCIVSDIAVANAQFDATFAVKDNNVAPYGVAVVSNDDFYVFSINGSNFEVSKDEVIISSEDIAVEGDVVISVKMLGTWLEVFVDGDLVYVDEDFASGYFFGLWAGGDFGYANVEASAVTLDYAKLEAAIALLEELDASLYTSEYMAKVAEAIEYAKGVIETTINQSELEAALNFVCGIYDDTTGNGLAATDIKINVAALVTIKANTIKDLRSDINVTPANASVKFTWSSSNPAVVAINSDGKIAALKSGISIITVTELNTELTSFITVRVNP